MVHIFLWAGLYTVPPSFSNSISKEEASQLEQEGEAYYIAEFDKGGNLITLEKRYERKRFFRNKYFYTNGKVSRIEVKNREGVTSSRKIEE